MQPCSQPNADKLQQCQAWYDTEQVSLPTEKPWYHPPAQVRQTTRKGRWQRRDDDANTANEVRSNAQDGSSADKDFRPNTQEFLSQQITTLDKISQEAAKPVLARKGGSNISRMRGANRQSANNRFAIPPIPEARQ